MRSFLFIALTFLMSACVHDYEDRVDTALKTWIGQHPDRLVESWGAPRSTYVFENGSKALTYEDTETYTRTFGRSFWWRNDTMSSSETCRINFYTDASQKKIERYSYKGYPSTCLEVMESTFKPSKG